MGMMSGSRIQACNHCQYTLLIAGGHLRCFCSESFDFAAGRLLPGLFNQRDSSVLCQLCCSMTSVNDGAGLKLGKFAAQLRHLPEQSQITASSLHLPRFVPLRPSSMTTPNTLGCLRGFGFQVVHLLLKLCGCAGIL